jgi:hypothetical protein
MGAMLLRRFDSTCAWPLAAAKLKPPSAHDQPEYEPAGHANTIRHKVYHFGGAAHERLNELNGCAECQRCGDQPDKTSEVE